MNLALKIANRLRLNPEGKGRRQSPGVTVAVAGIAVSVAVMLLTLAVVKGFQNQVKQKVMGFDSQISVSRYVTNPAATLFLCRYQVVTAGKCRFVACNHLHLAVENR